ncbi:MAG: hypothetical protein ACR2KT_02495 [Methylocella sp.]
MRLAPADAIFGVLKRALDDDGRQKIVETNGVVDVPQHLHDPYIVLMRKFPCARDN